MDGQRAVSWMGKNPLQPENAKRGAAIFQQPCAYCHVKNADGGTGAMTYQIGGRQYLITAVDSVVYAWTLPPAQ